MTDEGASRINTAAEQGIYNDFMAQAAESGVWPSQPAIQPAAAALAMRRHVSYRGGRSYPEGHPGQQPEQYMPLTAQEVAARQEVIDSPGHRAAADVANSSARNAITKNVEDPVLRTALLRAREMRRSRSARRPE